VTRDQSIASMRAAVLSRPSRLRLLRGRAFTRWLPAAIACVCVRYPSDSPTTRHRCAQRGDKGWRWPAGWRRRPGLPRVPHATRQCAGRVARCGRCRQSHKVSAEPRPANTAAIIRRARMVLRIWLSGPGVVGGAAPQREHEGGL
jgi:hypothetical protein